MVIDANGRIGEDVEDCETSADADSVSPTFLG